MWQEVIPQFYFPKRKPGPSDDVEEMVPPPPLTRPATSPIAAIAAQCTGAARSASFQFRLDAVAHCLRRRLCALCAPSTRKVHAVPHALNPPTVVAHSSAIAELEASKLAALRRRPMTGVSLP